jgi:hypothetical protein
MTFNLEDCSELGVEAKKTGGIRVKFDPFDALFASRVTNNVFQSQGLDFFCKELAKKLEQVFNVSYTFVFLVFPIRVFFI